MKTSPVNWILPPRKGEKIELPAGTQRIIIVGANGAGKSRFASRLASSLGDRVFRASALQGLYGRDENPTTNSIDGIYRYYVSMSPVLRPDLKGEFERLVGLMLMEETASMFMRRYGAPKPLSTEVNPHRKTTTLQRLTRLWNSIFPDNDIMLETGGLLFSNDAGRSTYSSKRLSDGEKAVIYHLGTALLAPKDCVMMIDNPGMFLHPSTIGPIWDACESIRRGGTAIYITHDLDFASQRASHPSTVTLWVRKYDADEDAWEYDLLTSDSPLTDDLYLAVMGSRKPVLFIEGDDVHSIDGKLYRQVFSEYNVKSLGSCNRVIEATRTFNDLKGLHNLSALGIVDRDRRNDYEVAYLRRRNVMVPDVAEVENLLMLEEVVRAVAASNRRDEHKVFTHVCQKLISLFEREIEYQALMHTRHRVKVEAEHTIDRRFTNIAELESHLRRLDASIGPRKFYEETLARFHRLAANRDYAGILLVYNRKSMLAETDVAVKTGVKPATKEGYINAVLNLLSSGGPEAERIRAAVRGSLENPHPVDTFTTPDSHPTRKSKRKKSQG